jgi:hypothetical protein
MQKYQSFRSRLAAYFYEPLESDYHGCAVFLSKSADHLSKKENLKTIKLNSIKVLHGVLKAPTTCFLFFFLPSILHVVKLVFGVLSRFKYS